MQCVQPPSLTRFPLHSGHTSPLTSEDLIYFANILHIAELKEVILSFTFLAVLVINSILTPCLNSIDEYKVAAFSSILVLANCKSDNWKHLRKPSGQTHAAWLRCPARTWALASFVEYAAWGCYDSSFILPQRTYLRKHVQRDAQTALKMRSQAAAGTAAT